MTLSDTIAEKDRLVALAIRAIERRGTEITKAVLATEAELARAHIDRIFPEEVDLFDAVVEFWFRPLVQIMEEVLASDLPPERKMYEFFARRFTYQQRRFHADPANFALHCELGSNHFEDVRSYIDLADHYLSELVAQAQAADYFPGLGINEALSLINQMVVPYTQPDVMMILDERLSEEKLATIIDTIFAGLSGKAGAARAVAGLRLA